MIFWGIIVLSATISAAAPCPQAAGVPCTPTASEKGVILDLINTAFLRENDMKAAAALRDRAASIGDYEEAFKQTLEVEANELLMNKNFAEAVAATSKAYNVGPRNPSGPVAAPRDPHGRGAWSAGLPANWKPEIITANNEVRQFLVPGFSDQYIGTNFDKPGNVGFTYPDGVVKIKADYLRTVLKNGNPGGLAYILHHESKLSAL